MTCCSVGTQGPDRWCGRCRRSLGPRPSTAGWVGRIASTQRCQRDELCDSFAQLLMRTAVATLCGALPRSATLLREDRLDATKWKNVVDIKRVRDPGVQPMPYQKASDSRP